MGWSDDYLEHHGILGQKWGVRRFENNNGHLTPAGLKRYEDGRKVTEKEKHAFSIKAAGHKALANVYGMNAKAYSKSNKTLSSMNKAAKTEQLKKAEQAQKEADAKKAEKGAAKGDKKGLTDKQKKMIIAGAAIAGTALAAYGGYKMYQINQQNKATKQAIDNATKALNDFKAAQSSMNRPNPIKPTSSSSFQNAAPKIDRATIERVPIDRVQVDRTPIDRIQIDRFEPDRFGFEKFSAAADMNDSFVQDLLKKNSSKLKGY